MPGLIELAATGANTTIVRALLARLAREGMHVTAEPIGGNLADPDADLIIPNARRYVLAAGVLHGKRIEALSGAEINECLAVNLVNVVRICERVRTYQPSARICVVGSLSGIRGSFDTTYAIAKAGVHGYVQFRETHWPQQLFAVAPSIISDSGMTMRRPDYPEILTKRQTVTAAQVADAIHRHLWDPSAEPLTGAVVTVQ